jgi:HSP20 family molecular chaperone IbpA
MGIKSCLVGDMFLLLRMVLLGERGEVNLSDRWRQRRKRCYEWLNRLDRADGTEKNLDEMLRRVLGNPDKKRKALERRLGRPEGVPVRQLKDSEMCEKSEPLIDVFEDQESVTVVTELIGIDKSNLDLHATQDRLTISIDSPDRKHYREVKLPTRVDVGSSSSRLKNGVLEIRLRKLREELVAR